MFCPECRIQYRDGFYVCADCHVPLVAELPPVPVVEHDLKVVTVLETEDAFALGMAQAALEEVGIEYMVSSDESLRQGYRGIFGLSPDSMPYQTCRIQVASEREAEARAILEPLANPASSADLERDPDEGN